MCEIHASEISKLGYCSNHRKLAEAQDMCEDCSSSRPNSHGKAIDVGRRIAFVSLVKEMGMISSDGEKKIENGEKDYRCSCCDVSLSSKIYSPYLLFQPSWGVLDYTQKGNLIAAAIGDENEGGEYSDPCKSDCPTDRCDDEHEIKRSREEDEEDDYDDGGEEEHQMPSDVDEGVQRTEEDYLGFPSSFQCEETEGAEDEKIGTVTVTEQEPVEEDDYSHLSVEGMHVILQDSDDIVIQICCREDASFEIIPLRSGDFDDHRLVPVELIDSTTAEDQSSSRCIEEDQGEHDHQEGVLDSESHIETQFEFIVETGIVLEEAVAVPLADGSEEHTRSAKLESIEMGEDDKPSVLLVEECKGDLLSEVCEKILITQATRLVANDGDGLEEAAVKESNDPPGEFLL